MTHVAPLDSSDKKQCWKNLLTAAGTEPRPVRSIHGYSGISHPVLGVGVDDKNSRIIIISSDHDARSAAMMQTDIRATFSDDMRVSVVRPVTAGVSKVAQNLALFLKKERTSLLELAELLRDVEDGEVDTRTAAEKIGQEDFQNIMTPLAIAFRFAPVPFIYTASQIIQELSMIDWSFALSEDADSKDVVLGIERVIGQDPTAGDRELGICALPFFEFAERDFELVLDEKRVEDIELLLKEKGIHQFFFPPVDSAILGLSDRTELKRSDAEESLEEFDEIGHPLVDPETTRSGVRVLETIDELQDRGYLAEGEIGFELTEKGQELRASVRFRPREGVISKVLNRFTLRDAKDIADVITKID